MKENDITAIVIDAAIKVHRLLGPGLLESVYERALAYELRKRGLEVETQVPIPIKYEDIVFDEGFRADMIIASKVLIELKSVETLHPVHKKQTMTNLKLSGLKVALLINFGSELLKTGITRLVNGLEDSGSSAPLRPLREA